MIATRNDSWLQKVLYLMIVVLGIYIVYKSGAILMKDRKTRPVSGSGTIQKKVEDASARTLLPGYAAAVEGKGREGWIAGFARPLVPVYSYLKQAQGGESEETDGQEAGADQSGGETEPETAGRTGAAEDEQVLEVFGRKSGISLSLLRQLQDFDQLLSGYYTLDEGTTIDGSLLDAKTLLSKDLSIQKNAKEPQILIYHTHSQERFADSAEGDVSTSIVGMGEVLAELLRGRYGYQVIHDTGVYDLVDGVLDRSAAYDYAREAVERILAENPTVEVVIDLHRDGVDGYKFVTEIDGKPTSKIMFFNGLSQDEYGNPLTWLENPYLEENLAFSLQLQLLARQQYPDFTRNIYLKAERFNLHLRARSLLIEAGTQLNTVEEEKNAMEPLASLLAQVLQGA